MQNVLLLLSIGVVSLFSNCTQPKSAKDDTGGEETNAAQEDYGGLFLYSEAGDGWECGSLRLVPITLNKAASLGDRGLITLDEAMQKPGFRVMEKKEFGRQIEGWFRGLTVQNKTEHPVLLLAGDVVKGGNQDRVIAQDYIIPARGLQNIEVFCVEAGRSHYYNPNAAASEKQLAGFYGYHSVCSPTVRSKVYAGEQSAVWKAVAQVTQANQAETPTQTYAAIGSEDGTKAKREVCVNRWKEQFQRMPNAVGFVAVSNERVVGVEIFCDPGLFGRRLHPLLEGLAVEAVASNTLEQGRAISPEDAFRLAAAQTNAKAPSVPQIGKTTHQGTWVHLYSRW